MRKSLSILLILALVLSIFSAISFAASSQSGLQLKGYGLINGNSTGDLMENSKWKRQDVAVILSRLFGKEAEAKIYTNTQKFTDVKNSYYNGYISWVKDKGLFTGRTTDLFGFNEDITYQEFLAVVLRALGYTGTTEVPFASVGTKAIDLGIIPSTLDIRLTANRVAYFDILLKAINTKNTDGVVLGTSLKLPGFKELPLTVNSVTGLTTVISHNTDKQFLTFSINGESKPTSVTALVAAGYSVNFQSSKLNLQDAATGEINEGVLTADTNFDYTVSISKDSKVISSPFLNVKVLNYSTTASKIVSYKLIRDTDVNLADGTISLSDTGVKFDSVVVEFLDGSTKTYSGNSGTTAMSNLKFESLNTSVAIAKNDGAINAVSPGRTTLTISSGNAKLDAPITVTSETRKATKATVNINQIKIVNALTKTIEVQVFDQFNNPFKGLVVASAAGVSVKKSDLITQIALISETTTGSGTSNKDGKVNLTLTADASNTGTGIFQIKNSDNTVLATLNVDIGAINVTTGLRKLESTNSNANIQLDLKTGSSTPKTITLNYNKYDTSSYYQGYETTNLGTDSTVNPTPTFIVKSSDSTIASITLANGVITVTGIKKGAVNIQVFEGTVIRASIPITIIDTTPVIDKVNFETVSPYTTAGKIKLSDILKTYNVILKDSDKSVVVFSDAGDIYIDADGISGYTSANDITLGKIELYSSVRDSTNNSVNVMLSGGLISRNTAATGNPVSDNFATGNTGQIVIGIKIGTNTWPTITKNVDLAIK